MMSLTQSSILKHLLTPRLRHALSIIPTFLDESMHDRWRCSRGKGVVGPHKDDSAANQQHLPIKAMTYSSFPYQTRASEFGVPKTSNYDNYPRERDLDAFFYFDAKDVDLESEECLWDLYERWMTHFAVVLEFNEKQEIFNTFKREVRFVCKTREPNECYLNRGLDIFRSGFSCMVCHCPICVESANNIDDDPDRFTNYNIDDPDSYSYPGVYHDPVPGPNYDPVEYAKGILPIDTTKDYVHWSKSRDCLRVNRCRWSSRTRQPLS